MMHFLEKQLLLFVLIILGLSPIETMAQVFQKYVFINDNDTLPYNLLFPQGYKLPTGNIDENNADSTKYPLVIFLHGAGERGNDNKVQIIHIKELFLNQQNQKTYKAFVLAPQCPLNKQWVNGSWKVSKHIMPDSASVTIELTMKLLEDISRKYPIDTKRIYVTGLSMGGFGAWDLICRYPGKFAAAIPICGGGDISKAILIKQTPVWAFHGSKDTEVNVNLSRDMISALKKTGANPKYTEYLGVGHGSWIKAFKEPELLKWLFAQSL